MDNDIKIEETESSDKELEESSTTETTENSATESTETSEVPLESETTESSELDSSSTVETTESTTTESTSQSKEKQPEETKESSTKQSESKKVKETPKESTKKSEVSNVTYSDREDATYVSSVDIKFIKNKSTEEFIESIGDKAREIGQEYDLYASVMIAQAILETGSGASELSQPPNHNLFGIKGSYKGESVSFNTSEDNGKGNLYTIRADFRKYPGYKESFEDYAELLTDVKKGNGSFYKETWKKNAKTYKDATKALTGRYATDTNYDKKLNKLIETYDLTFFDDKLNGDSRIQSIYYDVKENDTIEEILKKHNISEEDFKKWNKKWLDSKKELTTSQRVVVGERKLSTFRIKNTRTKKESDFIIPLKEGYVISSPFGDRGNEHHNGIDLALPSNTLIYASSKGKVVAKGFDPSAGNYVILQHENGLFTSYFHMNRSSVSLDEKVEMGDMIGYVGSTGNSTGSHLHFAINTDLWRGYMNPSNYMNFNDKI
jgi:flagellum-specific peptidoglycan hydrolase FlgJ